VKCRNIKVRLIDTPRGNRLIIWSAITASSAQNEISPQRTRTITFTHCTCLYTEGGRAGLGDAVPRPACPLGIEERRVLLRVQQLLGDLNGGQSGELAAHPRGLSTHSDSRRDYAVPVRLRV